MSNNALDQLEQQLERSIENVRQIKIIVSDFQPQGQPALNQVLKFNRQHSMISGTFTGIYNSKYPYS